MNTPEKWPSTILWRLCLDRNAFTMDYLSILCTRMLTDLRDMHACIEEHNHM